MALTSTSLSRISIICKLCYGGQEVGTLYFPFVVRCWRLLDRHMVISNVCSIHNSCTIHDARRTLLPTEHVALWDSTEPRDHSTIRYNLQFYLRKLPSHLHPPILNAHHRLTLKQKDREPFHPNLLRFQLPRPRLLMPRLIHTMGHHGLIQLRPLGLNPSFLLFHTDSGFWLLIIMPENPAVVFRCP
jgi:hypothetical protein